MSQVIIDLFSFCKGVGNNIFFINDKVIDVDFNKNTVYCESVEIEYDYLVLAVGSRTFFPPILRERFFKE